MKLPDWAKSFPHGIIDELCEKYDVKPEVLYAIIKIESGGCEYATRFEPGFKSFYSAKEFAKENLITRVTEEIHQATSFGYMQILGSTARRLGMESPLVVLLDPATNIEYGCKLLVELRGRYKNIYDVAAAYNAGKVRRGPDGKYRNLRYVEKFQKFYQQLTLA